jgi:hypothetical protein
MIQLAKLLLFGLRGLYLMLASFQFWTDRFMHWMTLQSTVFLDPVQVIHVSAFPDPNVPLSLA